MCTPGAWGDEETRGQGTHFILQSLFESFLLFPSSKDLFVFSHLLRTSKVTMVGSKLETFANPLVGGVISRASWLRSESFSFVWHKLANDGVLSSDYDFCKKPINPIIFIC